MVEERAPVAASEAAEAPAVRRRRERGPNPTTLLAVRACHLAIELEGFPKGGAEGLAERAATIATEMGLDGAERLDASGSTMWNVANEFIKGEADFKRAGRPPLDRDKPR
jgi:hypothetical protein